MGIDRKYRYLFKNVGILTISNFSSKILVFLLVPLYTSVLSTEEYGIYDLVITSVQLVFPILTVNIIDAVMRFCMDKGRCKEDIAWIGFKYVIRSFIAMMALLFICDRTGISKSFRAYMVYIILYYVFYVFDQYLIQLAKGLEHIADMGMAGIIGTIFLVGGNIVFLLVFHLGLSGFFAASILSQAGSCLYLSVRVKPWKYILKGRDDKALEKEMLRYCVPLIFTVIGWWINGTADRYTVAFICGIASNGLLSVAYKIPSIINTLQNIFIQAWQVSAIKEYGGKDTPYFYGIAFLSLNMAMGSVCSLLILTSKQFARFLYAKDFYLAWKYVPFLLLSCVINCASGFLGPVLSAKKDSRSMALSALYGVTANIILNIVFVYMIGVQGATIATLISSYIIYIVRKKSVGDMIHFDHDWMTAFIWGLLLIQSIIKILSLSIEVELLIFVFLIAINVRMARRLMKDKRAG